MSREIPKNYDPSQCEDEIYEAWEKSGFFNPDNLDIPKDAETYSIIMPPPNVTGLLHMGSAMMLAVEDLLIRYNRMRGKRTLWVPGTDHAAIATQNRVEKNLKKEGLDRHSLGREEFLERVNAFAAESQKTMIRQMKKMGSSCDWSRLAYTLDETRSQAVRNVFKLMHDDGLIYRGYRIVNWCPRCQSTLSDDEVEYRQEKAKLYWIKYGPFVLATTRPETKLGDTAVAVHPDDERYKDFVGKKYMIPGVLGEFEVEVVADPSVDPTFGSGAVKVTPAHDFADYETAQRHGLPMKQIIDEQGRMMENCGKYAGMTTDEAREAIAADMEKMGLIDHIDEDYDHNISLCYRCGTRIEPIPSTQWFIDVNKKIPKHGKSIKELSQEAIRKGVFGRSKIRIIPERFEKNYFHWMDNLRDWCISRQIWFGHRLPVWYKGDEIFVGTEAPAGEGWKQDEDTLDTWFSSGLWSFSTMAHDPSEISIENGQLRIKSADFKDFHPTSVLETMYDILFFWVARMIIMTTYCLGDIPFQDIYLHGCVRDKFGDKMSKSKPETNIDPLEICPKYGTDAVRLSLLIGTTPGNDTKVYEEKISNLRNFVTKIWNIYRYCATAYPGLELSEGIGKEDLKTLSDRWIVSRINQVIAETTASIEEYKFSMAGEKLQSFIWDEFADWYVEISKLEKNAKVIGYVLDKILKLAHPFTPFVTERIYQDIKGKETFIMTAHWPETDESLIDEKALGEFAGLQALITRIRNVRASYRIEAAKVIESYGDRIAGKEIIEKLARVRISEMPATDSEKTLRVSEGGTELELDVYGLIDAEKEKARIAKEIEMLEKSIAKIEAMLGNEKFVSKAPEEIIKENRERLEEYSQKLEIQRQLLSDLG